MNTIGCTLAKPRYKVNLGREQQDCERSYWLLSRLLPEDVESHFSFSIPLAFENKLDVDIELLEQTRFTRHLRITQVNPAYNEDAVAHRSLRLFLEIEIRVYDDVKMAEVICWQKNRRIEPRYGYPNQTMYQPNEKAQQNRFLADWLSYCVDKGISKYPVLISTEV